MTENKIEKIESANNAAAPVVAPVTVKKEMKKESAKKAVKKEVVKTEVKKTEKPQNLKDMKISTVITYEESLKNSAIAEYNKRIDDEIAAGASIVSNKLKNELGKIRLLATMPQDYYNLLKDCGVESFAFINCKNNKYAKAADKLYSIIDALVSGVMKRKNTAINAMLQNVAKNPLFTTKDLVFYATNAGVKNQTANAHGAMFTNIFSNLKLANYDKTTRAYTVKTPIVELLKKIVYSEKE